RLLPCWGWRGLVPRRSAALAPAGGGARRRLEGRAAIWREGERARQALHGVAVGTADAALQVLDPARAQPGPLGQRPLRQAGSQPLFPQECAKRPGLPMRPRLLHGVLSVLSGCRRGPALWYSRWSGGSAAC